MTRIVMAWSSGKDASYALHRLREDPDVDVLAILTTITDEFARVSMHGVREEVLDLQARALDLPCVKVRIPFPCPDEVYEERMRAVMEDLKSDGVQEVAFGDLFLQDVRRYRERNLEMVGMGARFPLWQEDTARLARRMQREGVKAVITALDPRKVDPDLAGRSWDPSLLAELPPTVDPCGENGEFHTVVTDGPMFARPIRVHVGEIVDRDGFVFADVVPGEEDS